VTDGIEFTIWLPLLFMNFCIPEERSVLISNVLNKFLNQKMWGSYEVRPWR